MAAFQPFGRVLYITDGGTKAVTTGARGPGAGTAELKFGGDES